MQFSIKIDFSLCNLATIGHVFFLATNFKFDIFNVFEPKDENYLKFSTLEKITPFCFQIVNHLVITSILALVLFMLCD